MTIPSDPMFGAQWHLLNSAFGEFDLNVVNVWDDYTGAGVRVAVVDDGIQWSHPDLVANYDSVNDYDYDGRDGDPTGTSTNSHGTAVTGIIGANAGNGIGGVGVAYGAELIGFRVNDFIGNAFVDQISNAISDTTAGSRQADIVNLSLGTSYQGNEYDKVLSDASMAALKSDIDSAAADGRGGLGTLIFKSAGNERQERVDANVSSWNANRHVVSTAAVDADGGVSYYSSFGANVLISGFGTSGSVRTTDRIGSEGYSSDDYTTSFNGTSAAAPMVGGVAALMLEANAGLGWRDVQEIMAYSARHVGSDIGAPLTGDEEHAWVWNGADNWNAGGLHFSNDYGYGLIDALAAVRLAETWTAVQTTANEATATQQIISAPESIDGVVNGGATFVSTGSETYGWTETTDIRVETVVLTLDFAHSWVGDIDISIVSPNGTVITVIDDVGGSALYDGEWQYTITGFWGESSAGDWQITLTDDFESDEFLVRNLSFEAFGNANTADDTYVFTNELSKFEADASRTLTLNDTDDGIDWVNAAAVVTDTTVALNATGLSIIDGIFLTTESNNLEHAVTGDGNDNLIGNWRANILSGMRGNDHLSAGSGHDTLLGGAGDDVMLGDLGDDVMDGGEGIDLVDYSKFGSALTISMLNEDARLISSSAGTDQLISIENLIGSRAADNIVGSQVDNHFDGNTGNDIISAQRGNDTVLGGDGTDQLRGNKGDDILDGQMGRDVLVGGAGADTFVVSDLTHSVVGGRRDRIVDFAQGEDLIDLTALDAITGGADNEFVFVGTQSFGAYGSAGALRYLFQGVKTLIEGDVDGDHIRDFQIEMIGNFTLQDTDFLL